MSNKAVDLEALLADLNQERAELDTGIEEMIADMATVPPERRSTSDWAPDGVLTRQFLDVTNRHAEVEKQIVAVSREIMAAKKPLRPN